MSIGNLKDNGNKGNNFPFQRSVLKVLGLLRGRAKNDNLSTNVQSAGSMAALRTAVDTFDSTNPDLYLVSRSIVETGGTYESFSTYSSL